MDVSKRVPLVLYSGLAADEQILGPQLAAFPQLVVPEWMVPDWTDTLDSYARRLADELPGAEGLVLGGVSFGGIVALHVAKYVKPQAIVLIGSVRSPEELPLWIRALRPLRPVVRVLPIRMLQWGMVPLASKSAHRIAPHLAGLVRQFRDCNPKVLKWSLARFLDWRSTPEPGCPVFHVRGEWDLVLPMDDTSSVTVVPGGGHVISQTHPPEVNAFIRDVLVKIAGRRDTGALD